MDFDLHFYLTGSFGWLSLCSNIISVYIVLYKTPKEMKDTIKVMILGRFGDFLSGFFGGVLLNAYFIAPIPAVGVQGLSLYLPDIFMIISLLSMLVGVYLSIFALSLQYFITFEAICGRKYSKAKINFIKILFYLSMVLFSFFMITCSIYWTDDSERKIAFIQEIPALTYYIRRSERILCANPNLSMKIFYITLLITLIGVFIPIILIFYFSRFIYIELQVLKKSRNEVSLKKYTKAVKMLFYQAMIPAAFFILPCTLLAIIIFLNYEDMLVPGMFGTHICCVLVIGYSSATALFYTWKYHISETSYFKKMTVKLKKVTIIHSNQIRNS
uniref:G_PROTEIN_RECEP_F1_2 domain-containing protein n=1 Tax=Rhabditophanes sp. KR3021 TaxID=114890 RepID=A0AC35TR84_9BILA